MIIVPPPFNPLFNNYNNQTSLTPLFNPKLFMKVFGITTISLSLLLTNGYIAHETSHKIKDIPTIERKIEEANRLKKDIKENWYFSPFLLGEYLTAKHYLKDLEKNSPPQ